MSQSDEIMDPIAFRPLRSARLHLRGVRLSDVDALVAYRSRPEIARFQSWTTFTESDALALVQDQQALSPDRPGTWFQVAIAEAVTERVIGDCGLHFLADDPRQVELGVTLHPDHHGRGLATEALAALLGYLFEDLGKHRVIAVTDAENHAAAAVFARLGFRREAHFVDNILFKGAYGSEFLFAMLKREWLARGGSGAPPPI